MSQQQDPRRIGRVPAAGESEVGMSSNKYMGLGVRDRLKSVRNKNKPKMPALVGNIGTF
jgi:hypothetical protein